MWNLICTENYQQQTNITSKIARQNAGLSVVGLEKYTGISYAPYKLAMLINNYSVINTQ